MRRCDWKGEDVENDSGRRLLSFSAENDFKVLNTFYEHNYGDTYTNTRGSVQGEAYNQPLTTFWWKMR